MTKKDNYNHDNIFNPTYMGLSDISEIVAYKIIIQSPLVRVLLKSAAKEHIKSIQSPASGSY